MSVKITLVGSDDGNVYQVDTIEHEGSLWLVPAWVEVIEPVGQEPARAVRLTGLDYQATDHPHADYLLKTTMPKSVLHGPGLPPSSSGFVVVVRPDDNRVSKPQ